MPIINGLDFMIHEEGYCNLFQNLKFTNYYLDLNLNINKKQIGYHSFKCVDDSSRL